jgi:ATP-dependent helicase HrpA/adenine-specific DNA-methyltransferase
MSERRNRPGAVKRAKALRSKMTDAELKLWSCVRRRQIRNARFRKQVPIGPYIADFACLELKLVIEVDGGQHDVNKPKDDIRTAWLEARGYRVLRFWNNEVLGNTEGVIEVIARAVGMTV